MIISNDELKKIYFGAYEFEEKDDFLKANQYSKPQMKYFEKAMDFWYERCDARKDSVRHRDLQGNVRLD